MELSKLQNPTKRRKQSKLYAEEAKGSETVKQEEDGTVTITKMDIQAASSGREKFGAGTKTIDRQEHTIEDTAPPVVFRYTTPKHCIGTSRNQ